MMVSLCASRPLDSRFCITTDRTRTWADFASDTEQVRTAIRSHDVICNMAPKRYDFAVMIAAALLNGQTTILPPSRSVRAVQAAIGGYSSPLMFEQLGQLALAPRKRLSEQACKALEARLPRSTGEVLVFTSGSTGTPVRHVKTWTSLAGGAVLTSELIARAGLDTGRTAIIGTTPHQHMYGLEATIFACLGHGYCLYDAPVFYPADLDAAVERVEELGLEEIVLVTSPPHIKFLEDSLQRMPSIRCLISATAPLHVDIARRLEAGGARVVCEIYGCTEAGSLAWRRNTQCEFWTPMHGFKVTERDGVWFADAPHLAETAELADEIEIFADGRFRLTGRRGDMISIAGKRQSLGALNAALTAMPELRDGVVVRETVDGEDRLLILLVPRQPGAISEGTLRRAVRAHMRAHFDPVFVPRAITVIDCLPRDATGKIPADQLAALMARGTVSQRN